MTIVTRQYTAMASQASEAVEKATDSWTQGVRRLSGMFPAVPQVDLVPAVERYFDLVQRAVDVNRDITVRWAQAAGTLTGAVRERAESAGQVVRGRAESAAEAVRERAESFDQAAAEQAEKAERAEKEMAHQAEQAAAEQARKAEQAEKEMAQEARRREHEHARQAHQRARERYEGLTKAELSDLLAKRGLPKSGNVSELVERLVETDGK
jgi:chromosome segregation ATPase